MGRDDSEFNAWKAEMEYKDNVEREEEIFKRKIEMKMSRDQAIKAQLDTQLAKSNVVKEFKVISDKIKEEHEEKLKKDSEDNRLLVKNVEKQKENIKLEQQKMKIKNINKKKDMQTKMNVALEQKRKDDEEELLRRQDLISKIRELAKGPIRFMKEFDPSTTAGIGLLHEMSIDQLRLCLSDMKEEEARVREEKNVKINEDKDQKKNLLKSKIDKVKVLRERQMAKREYDKSRIINNKVVIKDN